MDGNGNYLNLKKYTFSVHFWNKLDVNNEFYI